MLQDHNFNRYPELTSIQIEENPFTSPHPQIYTDFPAHVEKVIDGDTFQLSCSFRDFNFPVRLLYINAPELSEKNGTDVRDFIKSMIEHKDVFVTIDPDNRVDKWGRLLGNVIFNGTDIGDMELSVGMATTFESRKDGLILSEWF